MNTLPFPFKLALLIPVFPKASLGNVEQVAALQASLGERGTISLSVSGRDKRHLPGLCPCCGASQAYAFYLPGLLPAGVLVPAGLVSDRGTLYSGCSCFPFREGC